MFDLLVVTFFRVARHNYHSLLEKESTGRGGNSLFLDWQQGKQVVVVFHKKP